MLSLDKSVSLAGAIGELAGTDPLEKGSRPFFHSARPITSPHQGLAFSCRELIQDVDTLASPVSPGDLTAEQAQ